MGPDGNLWFTDRGDDAIGVVTLNPASSTHLVVTQPPPASITAGSPFGLTVAVEDSSGNLVSSFDGTVTVGLASNPGGTTLGGKLVVAASGGVATFSGLTLDQGRLRLYALRLRQRAHLDDDQPLQRGQLGHEQRARRDDHDQSTGSVAGAAGARQPGSLGRPAIKRRGLKRLAHLTTVVRRPFRIG